MNDAQIVQKGLNYYNAYNCFFFFERLSRIIIKEFYQIKESTSLKDFQKYQQIKCNRKNNDIILILNFRDKNNYPVSINRPQLSADVSLCAARWF